MKNIQKEMTLRSTDEGYEHRSWSVLTTGLTHRGWYCVVQNKTKAMESKPTRTIVEYLIKLHIDGDTTYPTVREAAMMLNTDTSGELEIDGDRKQLDTWREDKKKTISLMKGLANWDSD